MINGHVYEAPLSFQFAVLAVHFYLAIPFGSIKLDKPGTKSDQFTGAELSDFCSSISSCDIALFLRKSFFVSQNTL